jgi:hypothetical protein
MADGQNAQVGYASYLLVGRESTFKTAVTCTAQLDFISASLKTTQEIKAIEAVTGQRTFVDKIKTSKVVEGEVEFAIAADNDASVFFLHNAMGGGAVATLTATVAGGADTTGAGVLEHTFSINNFDASNTSLSLNHRKGDSTNGKVFEYNGVRVGEFTLTGEIDEALMANASVVAVDSTITSNSLSANITATGQTPLSFASMRLSIEPTLASLTTSAFWHVQSFEWGINNNLKSDSDSRKIGSDILDVLPAGIANIDFTFSMRFDTTTAYSAMLNETQYAAQLDFVGATYTGSKTTRRIRINMPRIYITDAGDPEIGGPDDILKAEITTLVMRDETASGYAVKALVQNSTTTY